MFDPDTCALVRQSIDDAFAAADAVAGQKNFESTPWYEHFVQQRNKGYQFGNIERHFVTMGAGVLAVDSPRAMSSYLKCISDAGIEDAISEGNASACCLENVVRPEFKAGDAMLFDEMALHRTGVSKSMNQMRCAIEMWFFAASMFPRDQVPLYL